MTRSPPVAGTIPIRADALRNKERVLKAARVAFADKGFDASYHEIARAAGVGVGTVYRRYPDRTALLEAVLLDIVEGLQAVATAAMGDADPWRGFAATFTALSLRVRDHAGLSAAIEDLGGSRLDGARQRLETTLGQVIERAREGGLRADVDWPDVAFLAQAAAVRTCFAGAANDERRAARAIGVVLDGLRTPVRAFP